MKKNIHASLVSLGCSKNFADAEAFFSLIPNVALVNEADADVVFLNTCGFLKAARDECFEHLNRLQNKRVIVTGCLASDFEVSDFDKYPQLWAVVSEANYALIPNILDGVMHGEKTYSVSKEPKYFLEMYGKTLLQKKSFAYIKIAEGCNNTCSYCLIPALKGKYRSRKIASIIDEAKGLLALGIKELILVSQDCGYYGLDLYGKKKLATLLKKLSRIEGDFWIRVLYVYPEHISKELLSVMCSSDKICRYLDIPLQHGSSKILKAMKRPSDTERTLNKISEIRSHVPDMTLRTTFIVGFPGETDSDFDDLVGFVKKISFDHVGVFEYSREPGTFAYDLPNQLPYRVKRARRNKIMAMQEKISAKNNAALVGQTLKVLIDAPGIGRSQRFTPDVDGVIRIENAEKLRLNDFCYVEITGSDSYNLSGRSAVG